MTTDKKEIPKHGTKCSSTVPLNPN